MLCDLFLNPPAVSAIAQINVHDPTCKKIKHLVYGDAQGVYGDV